MISYLDPVRQIANAISNAHQKHIDTVFTQAILDANGGTRPTDDELRQWCKTLVMPDGPVMLTWCGEDNVIAKVGPPEIFEGVEPPSYLS